MNENLYQQALEIRSKVNGSGSVDDIINLGFKNGALALKVLKAEICEGDLSNETLAADYVVCRTNEELARIALKNVEGKVIEKC